MQGLAGISAEWIVGGGIAAIIWLVRLEGRVNQAAREIDLTNKRIDTLQGKHDVMDQKLTEIRECVVRIEVLLENRVKP